MMRYILHCTKCHHEWETFDNDKEKCDWCGAESYVLTTKKPYDLFKIYEYLKSIRKGKNKP